MNHVRPYVPHDATAIAEVILSIQRNEFEIPITLEAQPDLTDIQGFYQQGAGNFWVAEIDHTVVGTIGLLDIGNKQAALRKMFVAAPYRGKEHGLAQLLLRELAAWSASRHLQSIYLGTTDKFLAAHRFYGKNGFKEIERDLLPSTFPIMSVDTRFYALTVTDGAT
jgi:N-acetylglutamate synthase-like GNAT family acetyltransferase